MLNFKKMFELKGSCILVLFLIVLSMEYVSLQSKSVLKIISVHPYLPSGR